MKNNILRRFLAVLVICAMLVTGLSVFLANAEEAVPAGEPAEEQILDISAEEEEPAEEPAEEEPAAEEPAEEPVVEEPATEEPVVEEPVVEEPVAEEPVVEEPVVEEPVIEEPVVEEPVVEEPVVEEPVMEEPVVEESVVEEPVAEEPVVEEPVVEEPVVEEPMVEEPVVEEPVAKEPVAEDPAVEGPVVEEHVVEEFEEYETALGIEEIKVLFSAEVAEGIAIRVEANGMSPIIRETKENEALHIISQEGNWYKILLNGEYKFGFVYKDDIVADEPAEEPSEETEQKPEQPKKVTIFTSRRVVMTVGEPVVLTSELEGFEDCTEVIYQWKVDKGNGFEIVPGANDSTYTFKATAESLGWGWRLTVSYR